MHAAIDINIVSTIKYTTQVDNRSGLVYNKYMSIDEMALREEIAREIEALPIEASVTNALGMRLAAAHIARGQNNYMTNHFETQVDFE